MIAFGGGRRTLAPHVLSSSDLELSDNEFYYRALFLPPGLIIVFKKWLPLLLKEPDRHFDSPGPHRQIRTVAAWLLVVAFLTY